MASSGEIFVFGSNRQGIHGAGAARHAVENWGAVRGIGEGLQGSSYAIPTKRTPWETLPLEAVAGHVATFLAFATAHPEMRFRLTAIGCGLAGFKPEQIAPLFRDAPPNVSKPSQFVSWETANGQ